MAERLAVQCCVAGGGPAGMMLGLLLARAGVRVVVLEKHADFLRDFRGDTIHPSTLQVIDELGWLDELLALPHRKTPTLAFMMGGQRRTIADFTHLGRRTGFIAMMPQWDFLDFLAAKAARYPTFTLRMSTTVEGLIERDGRVVGLRASSPTGPLEVEADLVVGADGRNSTVRDAAGLEVDDQGAPMDVLWFRISRASSDPDETTGSFGPGLILVLINRGDYWQCGYVVAKGAVDDLRAQGIESVRHRVAEQAPFLADRVAELRSWDDLHRLTVRVDRLKRWYRPGLLCIGDAAHAMSPVGGVGINLAIQDAVAAANLLARPLRAGITTTVDLAAVERRRTFPTRATQALQVAIQNRVIRRVLGAAGPLRPPLLVRVIAQVPLLRRIPALLIGRGVRPEHVHTIENVSVNGSA